MQLTGTTIADAARAYLDAGLSVLPARRDVKYPALPLWGQYKERLPTRPEVDAWFANDRDALCIVTGAVSGNAEMIDFDYGGEKFDPWCEKVRAAAPGLMEKLVIEGTQSGGWHTAYRNEGKVCGSMKLAQRKRPVRDEEITLDKDGREIVILHGKEYVVRVDKDGSKYAIITLIETKGDGGLFLCDPTDGYALVQGDFCDLPVLTAKERDILLRCARELNEYTPPVAPRGHTLAPGASGAGRAAGGPSGGALRPGDDFNARGDVRALLEQHGWTLVKGGENEYWRRPGKEKGTSATLKDGVFYVFSSNAPPFDADTPYAPFSVYALLEHDGDFEQAARALRAEGYGGDEPDDSDVDLSGILANLEPAPSQARRMFVRWSDIKPRPPSWLIRGLLERDSLAQIYGESGSGKTFFGLDVACRLATGTPWREHAVQPAPVFYLAGEGRQGIGRRLAAWATHHGVTPGDAPLFVGPAVAVTDPDQLARVMAEIAAEADGERPGLIVLDTLARCFGGGDENSTQDMSQFVSACDALRGRWGCCVLVVHHTGLTDRTRSRGNSALRAALDAEYRINQPERGILRLTATKMKDAEIPPPLSLELVTVELPGMVDEYGNPVTSAAVDVIDADTSAIESAVKSAGRPGTWAEIILGEAARMSSGQLEDLRQACVSLGLKHRSTWTRTLAKLHADGRLIVDTDEGEFAFPNHPKSEKSVAKPPVA